VKSLWQLVPQSDRVQSLPQFLRSFKLFGLKIWVIWQLLDQLEAAQQGVTGAHCTPAFVLMPESKHKDILKLNRDKVECAYKNNNNAGDTIHSHACLL